MIVRVCSLGMSIVIGGCCVLGYEMVAMGSPLAGSVTV